MKCNPKLLCAIVALVVNQAVLSADGDNDFFSHLKNSESLTATTVKYANGRLSSSGEGRQLLVSAGGSVESNASLGDSVLTIEYLAEDNANAGIYLQGRYEIALVDTDRDQNLTFADAGGVQKRASAIQG
ncbi:MAG: hypothetical protein RLN85_07455, partial [Pseudomonadales bacterium]